MPPKSGFSAEVKGLKELEKNLLDLGKEFGFRNARTSLSKPLKDAMQPVEDQIRQNTPVDQGLLVNSLASKIGRGRGVRDPHLKSKDVVQARRVGWFGNYKKMLAIEFGTRQRPAGNIIRGALEDNFNQVVDTFTSGLKQSIEKATNRLNKRKALGKLKIR